MKKALYVITVMLIALAGCQKASPPTPALTPSLTPKPPPPTETLVPPTATHPPAGISGTVEYTGPSSGGIVILVMDKLPAPNEPPNPLAANAFTDIKGEINWELPPGTYYIIAFLTINRPPQGPTQPNEPLVFCDPIEVKADQQVLVNVVLTDDDIGGKGKSCVK